MLSEPPGATCRNPPVRLRGPVGRFDALNASVPAPALVRPPVPASDAAIVAFAPVPSAFVVIGGAVPARVSVFEATPALSKIQLAGVIASLSPRIKPLRTLGESRCTMLFEVMSRVLKSAVFPAPSAITAFCQLAESLHRPPLV